MAVGELKAYIPITSNLPVPPSTGKLYLLNDLYKGCCVEHNVLHHPPNYSEQLVTDLKTVTFYLVIRSPSYVNVICNVDLQQGNGLCDNCDLFMQNAGLTLKK